MTEPTFPKFNIVDHIKIEETECVNDELVPVVQFNISVSKEALQDHKFFWLDYFKKDNDYRGKSTPTPEEKLKMQIYRTIVSVFEDYTWKKLFDTGM